MSRGPGLAAAAPRLIAEFLVIFVGVMVALAADQWVQGLEDRRLEDEYLERLRADVGYDRDEILFVQAVSIAGRDAVDSLSRPEFVAGASDLELVGAALLAAGARQIDLSRGTWNELVASGRIELLEDAEVRLALAEYDRFTGEIAGYWDYTANDLRPWVIRRVPAAAYQAWDQECDPAAGSDRFSTSQPTGVCEFPIPPSGADRLRAELTSEEAVGELRLQRQRFHGLLAIIDYLIESVDELERVLENTR